MPRIRHLKGHVHCVSFAFFFAISCLLCIPRWRMCSQQWCWPVCWCVDTGCIMFMRFFTSSPDFTRFSSMSLVLSNSPFGEGRFRFAEPSNQSYDSLDLTARHLMDPESIHDWNFKRKVITSMQRGIVLRSKWICLLQGQFGAYSFYPPIRS